MCSSTLATAASSINGPCSTPSSNPLPTFRARTASERRSTNASWMPSCTSSRFAQTHVWPVLRNFDAIAPSTAASRSASSKTRSGALPPSSSETFLIVPAHFAISSRPTSVEPVNVSLRTVGFVASSSPTTDDDPGNDSEDAGRHARALRELRERQRGEGRRARGLRDHRAPRRQSRSCLARDHRHREVPRRDRGADADRLLEHDHPAARRVRGDRLAVDPLRLLGVPLDEGGAVEDLALRLGQRLALLGGEDHREVVGRLDHQVEPAAQDRRPLLRGQGRPCGERTVGGVDRPPDVVARRARDGAERQAVGGVDDLEARPVLARHPCRPR